MKYEILGQESIYRGFLKIDRYRVRHELYQGGESEELLRECLVKGSVVAGLAFDPKRREFVFVEQFRIGAAVADLNAWQLEVVAGFVDNNDDTPEKSMQREFREEIGCEAIKLHSLGVYHPSLGGNAGKVYLFWGEIDASQCVPFSGLAEEGEDIRVVHLSYDEVLQRLRYGKFDNANTLVVLHKFFLGELLK